MKNNSRKNIFVVLSVIAVFAVILLIVSFIGKRQDIRQQAAIGDAVTFTINPTTAPGTNTFTATLALQGKGNDISAVDITINSSDVTKLEITGFTPTTTYTQIGTTTLGSGGSSMRYVGVNPASTPIIGTGVEGEITLGTLSLTVKGSGGGTLSVAPPPTTIVTRGDGGGTTLGITNTAPLATYTVSAAATDVPATPSSASSLPAPTGLTAQCDSSGTKVTISWTPYTGESDGYFVIVDKNAPSFNYESPSNDDLLAIAGATTIQPGITLSPNVQYAVDVVIIPRGTQQAIKYNPPASQHARTEFTCTAATIPSSAITPTGSQ